MRNISFSNDDIVWLLGAACQLHCIPFDARLALGQNPPPHTLESLREALAVLGLRSGIEKMPLDELSTLSAICFVTQRLPDDDGCRLVLLLHCDGERVLSIASGQTKPVESSLTDFGQHYAGFAMHFAPESRILNYGDDSDSGAAQQSFGIRRFLPDLKKHKSI